MKWLSRILIIAGILLIGIFGFTLHDQNTRQSVTLEEAQKDLEINRAAFAEEKEKKMKQMKMKEKSHLKIRLNIQMWNLMRTMEKY